MMFAEAAVAKSESGGDLVQLLLRERRMARPIMLKMKTIEKRRR